MRYPNTMRYVILLLLAGLSLNLTGCGWLPKGDDETAGWSASRLYSTAKSEIKQGDYTKAIELLRKLEARYPFGRYAQQAQMEIAYAYYKDDEPESAIAAADRFIKLYPRHRNVDYLYYLKGLVNFYAGRDLLAKYLPIDPTQRDPGSTTQSFQDFSVLVEKFPNSRYARDAVQRMIFLRNNLGEYELHVADYYMRRGAWLAAANRAKYVIEQFQHTTAVPGALATMARAYRKLELNDLAEDALRVLRHNYPRHPALAELDAGGQG